MVMIKTKLLLFHHMFSTNIFVSTSCHPPTHYKNLHSDYSNSSYQKRTFSLVDVHSQKKTITVYSIIYDLLLKSLKNNYYSIKITY